MPGGRELRVTKFVLVLSTMVAASAASAQDYRGVAFGGGSVGDGRSAYAGAVVALPGASLGKGLAIRGSVNAGTYRYENGLGRIDADYRGAEAAMVYQLSGDWGWANLAAGPRVSNLDLAPDDPDNQRRGTTWDLGLQVDGAQQLGSDWRLDYLGSIGLVRGAYGARLGLGHMVREATQTRLGVEGAVQGDPRYTTFSTGLFAATQVAKDLEAQLSAGARHQEGRSLKPYVSLGVSLLY